MPVVRRDAEGLTFKQRYWLTQLALSGSWDTACAKAKCTKRAVHHWMREPGFRMAYDSQFAGTPEAIRAMIAPAAEKAVETLVQALTQEETKTIEYACPHDDICDLGTHTLVIDTKVPWSTRMKAVMAVLKAQGVMIERTEHKMEGEVHVVNLTAAESLALARLRAGFEIPGDLQEKFEQLAREGHLQLKRGTSPSVVVEGEYHEVDSSSE